jgi:CRISPR system Cascade subunit CasA
VCRRVRLRRAADGIEALVGNSKCARVSAAALKGKTGDPWAPIKADQSASVTPTGAGFGYRQMSRLLDQTVTTPPFLAKVSDEDAANGLTLVANVLVRGSGKTEGLHRRVVRTSRIEEIDGDDQPLDRIGDVAKLRSDEAGEAGKRLRRALISLVQGGPDQARLDDDAAGKKVDPWVRRFDARVDRVFFDDAMWREVARHDEDHRRLWRERLREVARAVFDEAAEAAPRTEVRRIRAKARARSYLEGQMTKWLKEVA